jgi:general secretion pathway protein E
MLASNTSAPYGPFVAFLMESAAAKDRVDWAALNRNMSNGRSDYHDLWEAGVLSAGDLADAVAAYHGLPRAQTERIQYRPELFDGLSRRFLRDAWIFPFLDRGSLALAVADPSRDDAIRAVLLALGEPAAVQVAAFDELGVLFEQGTSAPKQAEPADAGRAPEDDSEIGSEENLERLQDLASGAPVVHTVDAMLEAALNASRPTSTSSHRATAYASASGWMAA